jgi:hypothetical protein
MHDSNTFFFIYSYCYIICVCVCDWEWVSECVYKNEALTINWHEHYLLNASLIDLFDAMFVYLHLLSISAQKLVKLYYYGCVLYDYIFRKLLYLFFAHKLSVRVNEWMREREREKILINWFLPVNIGMRRIRNVHTVSIRDTKRM